MSKIMLRVQLKNEEQQTNFETKAILNKDVVKYKEEDNTTVIFNISKKELTRENNQMKMIYTFQKEKLTEGIVEIKGFNQALKVMIETKEIIVEENRIKVEYNIEEKHFIYQMEVIE